MVRRNRYFTVCLAAISGDLSILNTQFHEWGKKSILCFSLGRRYLSLNSRWEKKSFHYHAIDQVWDYALDLKNFHETSHEPFIAPILIATNASQIPPIAPAAYNDKLLLPLRSNSGSLAQVIADVLSLTKGPDIDPARWEAGSYQPTPTIVEAAMALYNGHSVDEISRNDASAINLGETSDAISEIIRLSNERCEKSICFVTGVPGAGKTLVGLNVATNHIDKDNDLYSVFLSGNGPLVAVLREALARDKVRQEKELGRRLKKNEAMRNVKLFIQNVHNFRDECLVDIDKPPIEHVALFDEAQRAWDLQQTANFMQRRKKVANFAISEPEFLISCLNRHPDWAVVVCLVGGGQEINTGEAGISEWIKALKHVLFRLAYLHILSAFGQRVRRGSRPGGNQDIPPCRHKGRTASFRVDALFSRQKMSRSW